MTDDFAAYARLRRRGLQPDQIAGCAELEPRATRDILTWAKQLTVEEAQQQREAMATAIELEELWKPSLN